MFSFKLLTFQNVSLFTSVFSCLLFATIYVLSLYLWSTQNRFNRSEPSVIKRRFISVLITCVISYLLVYLLADEVASSTQTGHHLNEWIGFKLDSSLLKSSLVAMCLTMILFAGPILQYLTSLYYLNLRFRDYESESNLDRLHSLKRRLVYEMKDLTFWRNYIVSPFTEEFVFRSCMLPLLVSHFGFGQTCALAPAFFAVAHLHHIVEGYFLGEPLQVLLIQHLFQFSYTYVFGVFSCYLFMRTGHFAGSFVAHSFCNFMGVPNLNQLVNAFSVRLRLAIALVYLAGLVAFFCLISTLTQPSMFNNRTFNEFFSI